MAEKESKGRHKKAISWKCEEHGHRELIYFMRGRLVCDLCYSEVHSGKWLRSLQSPKEKNEPE